MPVLSLALVGLLGGPPEPPTPETHDPRFALDWQAPASCPVAAHVEGRVAALLGERPSAGPSIEARARVSQRGRDYEVELSLRSGEEALGVRTLRDRDCAELAEGVALILALAIDPELLAGPSEAPSDDEPSEGVGGFGEFGQRELDAIAATSEQHEAEHAEQAERAEAGELDEPSPSPTPPDSVAPRRPAVHLGAYALAGVGVATLPGTSGRVDAGMLVSGEHWRLELGASGWLPRRIAEARYQAWSVELAGCGVARLARGWGAIEFPICARVEVGAMLGESLGLAGRRARAPWLAGLPGAGVIVRPGRARGMLGVMLRADAVLPLTRPAFATDEGALLVRAGFGAQILVGLELRLSARRARERTRPADSAALLDRSRRGHRGVMPARSAE